MPVAEANLNDRAKYHFKGEQYSSHWLLLRRFAEPGRGRRVLDVGCSEGFFGDILAQRGYSVTGVDWPGTPHPDSIEFHGVDLDNGITEIGGGFDFIVCADVLEHLRDPLRILRECRERLAPGGVLIASLPNSGHWYFRTNVVLGRFPRDPKGLFDRTHLQFYMWDGWLEPFEGAGFRIEAMESSSTPFRLGMPTLADSWLVRVLERASYEAAKLWKRLFAYQFVIVARPEEEA